MNYVLLPFLLATRLPVDQDWTNGPEFVFDARASMITNLHTGEEELLGTTLVSEMRCRLREPDRLLCHFQHTNFSRITPKGFDTENTIEAANANFSRYGFGSTPFEIHFDEKGIDDYQIQNGDDLGNFLMNMYRMLANQLSIGVNLRERRYPFKVREVFTYGDCHTNYNVIRNASDPKLPWHRFEMVPLISSLSIRPNEMVEIVKKRFVDTCTPQLSYFFGTRFTFGVVRRGIKEELTNSTSRMIIWKTGFITETVNIVDVTDTETEKRGTILDHIYLHLQAIEPAIGPLPTIKNPKQAGVMVEITFDD